MKEAQYILQSVTPTSLIVLDELCRHTAVEEGSAIAWSIYEKLALTSAYTFAVTHFLHLTALSNMHHNIETYEILRRYNSTQLENTHMFTHQENISFSFPSALFNIFLLAISQKRQ
jgi:DNA mismatch repair protein MSH4